MKIMNKIKIKLTMLIVALMTIMMDGFSQSNYSIFTYEKNYDGAIIKINGVSQPSGFSVTANSGTTVTALAENNSCIIFYTG